MRQKTPRSVIPYIGGKHQLVRHLVPLIEYTATLSCTDLYELCGGGGRIVLNTPPHLFSRRTYNDIDTGVCNLFAMLGIKEQTYNLMAFLEPLRASEELFLWAREQRKLEEEALLRGTPSPVTMLESAAATFIAAMWSRAADMVNYDQTREQPRRAEAFQRRVAQLPTYYDVLADIQVTSGNMFLWLEQLQFQSNAICYIDPPYVEEAMIYSGHYGIRSWGRTEHQKLVNALLRTKAKVVLSGYDNDLYTPLTDNGWSKLLLSEKFISSSATVGRRAREYVWVNYKVPESLERLISESFYS
ncbi:DNA adenine methylase [Paenibacillaceae bacterium WGS1546]|uniref:DNA adenine methylase n=1 Tax=Cohnella sp. WGS1546 TaxID=3366810 RepID=UPI00372D3E38